MHTNQQYIPKQRADFMNSKTKKKYDDFYAKLERIRLSAATSSSKLYRHRTATELLDESKAFFVKSQQVLQNRQTLSNNQPITTTFRRIQSNRSPFYECEYEQEQYEFDIPFQSSDCAFESISVLSLSDQTTLNSTHSRSYTKRTVVPSSITIIERNARIIKWLFQLHKTNESYASQCS